MTPLLAVVALISAFGSSFQYGYNISVINAPAPVGGTVERTMTAEQGHKPRQERGSRLRVSVGRCLCCSMLGIAGHLCKAVPRERRGEVFCCWDSAPSRDGP